MDTTYNIKTEMRDGNRIAIIPPSTAEKIFNERVGNRPIHLSTAKLYAKAMEDGRWKPSSQISFCNGRLDDGQHRMMASILSGCTFEGTIYYHDDPDTFAVFDIGKKRTNGDILSKHGKKYANSLSACLQLMEKINSTTGLPKGIGGNTRVIIPTYEILDVLAKYPDIEYSVAQIHNNQKYFKILCSPGAQAITHHTMFFGGIATWNKWIKNQKSKLFRIPEKMPKVLIP
jgi:hypothetical protein